MHLIALIIDVHQHPIPSAEADASCSSVARKTRHDIYKDQFHFEHIREQSGQACSRLVCMIMYPDLSKCIAALIRSGIIRICFLFTMSWNPQISRAGFWLCNAMICETLFCMDGLQKKESILVEPAAGSGLPDPSMNALGGTKFFGGAGRDRTDDLKLAKLPLSQLSYGPTKMVGLGRLELPTSRLSSARSNQLSYKPKLSRAAHEKPLKRLHARGSWHSSIGKKEKRRRRRPAYRV